VLFNPRRRLERHLVDTIDALRIELVGARGRICSSNKSIKTNGFEYLQLGCGDDLIPGFLNSDYFTNNIDIRFPLRFPADTWGGIYAHHTVEHIVREVWRILRPGGTFRMIVPDLEVFLRCYSQDNRIKKIFLLLPPYHMAKLTQISTLLEMIDYIFCDSKFNRHPSAWDWETSQFRLSEAGFTQVLRQSTNVSVDPVLSGHDKQDWAAHSNVDAIK
jgi:predicted SAM-dependent methyltransferase